MIIGNLIGGPHDGRVIAMPELTPLTLPVVHAAYFGDPATELRTITYFPRSSTMQLCPCCPNWAHPTVTPSVDLRSITYSQHFVCNFYPAGS